MNACRNGASLHLYLRGAPAGWQRASFSGRLLPDSQSALDEIRGDRF